MRERGRQIESIKPWTLRERERGQKKKAEKTVLHEGEWRSRGGEIEDFERNKHERHPEGIESERERHKEGAREREGKGEKREVAKIVSILLILPQRAETEMAEAAVQIITLSCLPGKYLLLSIKKAKRRLCA